MENQDGTLTVEKITSEGLLAQAHAAAQDAIQNCDREPFDRHAWLQARRSGLGGSDAAAVLGLSPWKSALTLWAEKTGKILEPNLDELEYIEWGQVLEEPIARKYAQVTKRTLIDHGRFAIRHHPERPWQHCTIDREVLNDPDNPEPDLITFYGNGDLSIKNATEFKRKDWEEEPPLIHQVQGQHELCVTGLQWLSFAVLVGGNKFFWCDAPRNDRFISYLVEREEEFWERVRQDIPPDPDASDSTKELLLRLYPKDTGESVALGEEFVAWADQLAGARAAQKAAEKQEQEAANMIKAAMKTATLGILPGGRQLTLKSQHRDGYTVAPTDFRVLREVKSKGKK